MTSYSSHYYTTCTIKTSQLIKPRHLFIFFILFKLINYFKNQIQFFYTILQIYSIYIYITKFHLFYNRIYDPHIVRMKPIVIIPRK
jgi:hypothetical protein